MGHRWDRVRAAFGVSTRTFDEPRTVAFSQPYQPVNALIEGIMRGIGRVDRTAALGVPAVLRGRNMICSVSTLPLEAVDAEHRVQDHRLLRQLDPNVPNVVMLAQTLEDLLFEAEAWWRITDFGSDDYPVSVVRYDPGSVSMSPPTGYRNGYLPSGLPTDGAVWMSGEQVPAREYIRFDSPNPAFLVAGQRAVKRAIALDKLADLYASNPQMRGFFSPKEGVDPDPDAVQQFLDDWAAGRAERVDGYVGAAMSYTPVMTASPTDMQLISQQQRADLAIANALGIDPEDLGINTTSRTYQNSIDRRQDRINETLAPYVRAITDRLSMPDVTKRGLTVRFSLRDYLKADPKTRAEVQQIYAQLGATDAAEIRVDEGRPPRQIETPAAAPSLPASAPRRVESTVGEPVREIEASGDPAHTFARETGLTFDGAVDQTFAVDTEERTITGLAVPYGQSARSGGRRWRFAKGSIRYSAVNRVKLLRDHDSKQAIGKAVRLDDTDTGIVATFKVSPGPRGDEALALALDGVLDGLSIGVDFRDGDYRADPQTPGGYVVHQAALREVSLTAVPAFDDSRLTSVTAAREEGPGMPDETTETTVTATPAPVTFSAEQFDALLSRLNGGDAQPELAEQRPTVNGNRPQALAQVREALPYNVRRTFNRVTGDAEYVFAGEQEHDFSTDLAAMARDRDSDGQHTDAGRRVMGLLRATFAEVTTGDVNELNPEINRPDMYVDQRDYKTPIMDLINRGAPPQGVQPFRFPKFSSASELVGNHTEGTEPASGSFVTTSQLVEPTAMSGKASITREVWDMGGNPAVSALIFNQMVRGYREGLEAAAATFLNTLTAATDIALTSAGADEDLAAELEAAVAELQFARGYDFSAFVLEKVLYKQIVAARDTTGRVLYPQINPTNANGRAATRFRTLDVAGLVGIPSWALSSTPGSSNNSWIFDPSTVHGWWTAPQRLEFPGSDPGASSAPNAYAPVAYVDLAIWGYKAFANSDIGGVRQVTYDSTS